MWGIWFIRHLLPRSLSEATENCPRMSESRGKTKRVTAQQPKWKQNTYKIGCIGKIYLKPMFFLAGPGNYVIAQDKITQNYINEISLYRTFLKGPTVAKQNKKPNAIQATLPSQVGPQRRGQYGNIVWTGFQKHPWGLSPRHLFDTVTIY